MCSNAPFAQALERGCCLARLLSRDRRLPAAYHAITVTFNVGLVFLCWMTTSPITTGDRGPLFIIGRTPVSLVSTKTGGIGNTLREILEGQKG